MPASLHLTSRFRRAAGHLIALVSLGTLLAGFAVARAGEPVPVTSAPAAAATTPSASARLTLRFDGHVATAILDETPTAREFAALLPLTLTLSDPMGQAKSGPLPRSGSLDVTGAERTFQTSVGQLAYWPPSATVAVVHEDLGQRVPAPGLIRLGVIDSGLSDLAAAGNRVTVRIDVATGSGF